MPDLTREKIEILLAEYTRIDPLGEECRGDMLPRLCRTALAALDRAEKAEAQIRRLLEVNARLEANYWAECDRRAEAQRQLVALVERLRWAYEDVQYLDKEERPTRALAVLGRVVTRELAGPVAAAEAHDTAEPEKEDPHAYHA